MSTADTLLAQLAQLDNAQDVVKWAKKRTRQIAQLNGESDAIWKAVEAKGVTAAALVDIQEAVAVKSSTMHVSKRIGDDLAKWGYHFWLNDMDDSIWNGDQRWTDSDNAVLRMTARDAGYAELRLLSALEDATTAIAAGRRPASCARVPDRAASGTAKTTLRTSQAILPGQSTNLSPTRTARGARRFMLSCCAGWPVLLPR